MQLIDRVRDLTDLLGGVDRQWLRNRLGALPHLRDLTLEVGVSDLQRTVAQLAQRPDQRTRHQEHHDHRDQDGAQHQHGVANRGVTPSAGPGLHRLGDRLGGVVDDLLGDPAGDLDRLQQLGLPASTLSGSEMIAIRVTICWCRVLASGEPTPSTSVIPNSVEGSVPARVIIELRNCASGASAPRVTRISCRVICPRAPTALLKP